MRNRFAILIGIMILTLSISCIPAFAAEDDQVEVILSEQTIVPDFDHDMDELFGQYTAKRFGTLKGNKAAMARTGLRRERLNIQEKIVYDLMKVKIDAIACGKDDHAVIDIPLSALDIQQSHTAEELGLESIFDENDPSVVTETARQAVNSKFQVGLMNILAAVMSDMPYELYWYDKTTGIAYEPPKIIGINNGKGGALVFDTASKVTFKMYVSADYSKSGLTQTFYPDTEKTGAASQSAANARAIVDEYKDLTDYEKLEKYKDEVISLTDYDYQAVEDYPIYGIYGDPWQLIHVFDGDPDTKVVCEGYAKAFQYLCDQSDFDDESLICNSVTGDMIAENGGGGAHMWNIVSIGGSNYICDLTNNDNVTDDPEHRAPTDHDELFMAGAEGSFEDGIYMISWDDDDPDKGPYYIQYIYDEDTIRYFDEEELTISDKPYTKQKEDKDKELIVVSMSLLGDSYHKDGDVHTLRTGTLSAWIDKDEYEVPEGSTVLDLLNQMLKRNGFHGTIDASGYVSKISDGDSRVLSEKDNSAFSGWMYTLNGEHVNKSVRDVIVDDGDDIVFHYTDDYRIEDESLDISEAESMIQMINGVPDEITLDDEMLVNEALNALASLDEHDPVLSVLITKEMRSKLDQAAIRIRELKGEKEQDESERALKELEEAKKNGLEDLRKLAEKYAAGILTDDEAGYTSVIMSAVSNIQSTLDPSDVPRIIDSARASLEKLAQNKKIASAKSLKVKNVRVKSRSRKFTVRWKKTGVASGYQVQMKKKGGKWKLIRNTAKAKVKTAKLRKGRMYQFRIRTYYSVSGRKYYGNWVRSKRVKCK